MANPRKFSEKIALLNQKQAEGNAEFERIMREVSEVSAKGDEASPTTLAGLLTTGYSNDINQNANADSKATSRESRGRSVGGGPMRSRSRNIDTSPYSNNAYLSPPQESSWRRTSSDSAIHQSLTQAQDIPNNVQSLMLSPRAHKRLPNSQSGSMKNLNKQNQSLNQQHSHSQQNMPQATLQQTLVQQQNVPQHLIMNNLQQDMKSRSVSRLPGIPSGVYPSSQNNELLQIPVGNSTGSLPDLTLVHYQQSPISNPIDPHELIAVTSSYATNPSFSMASTNQTTTNQLSSMTQQQQQQMYTQMRNNLDQFSPQHFSNNNSNNNNGSNNNGKGSSSQNILIQQGNNEHNFAHHPSQPSPIPIDSNQRQQSSPLHHQSYPNQTSVNEMMNYRSTNAASPAANLSMSQGNLSKNSYRSSPNNNRPSPGSSPIGNVPGLTANFDSNSSAPCSPSPQMTAINGQFDTYPSADTFYLNPSIQQHFEQFSLVDNPLPDYITATNDQNYSQNMDTYNGILNDSPNRQATNRNNVSRPNSRQQHSPTSHQTSNHDGSSPHSPLGSDTMLSGNGYDRNMMDNVMLSNGVGNNGINDIMLGAGIGSDSSSKLISSSNSSLQNSMMMSTTSPSHLLTQTTTAIPEIILSEHIDYSTGSIDFSHDLLQDNFLELGMNSTELQMTFDNASIIDPSIEENFRRDLY